MAKESYNVKIARRFLDLCGEFSMPYRIRRFIPDDHRAQNYRVAEKLLNQAYELMITGRAWTNLHWAGMNIQNLKESIIEVAKRGELRNIRNVTSGIEAAIQAELEGLS